MQIRAVLFYLTFFLAPAAAAAAGAAGPGDAHSPVITMQTPGIPPVVFMERIVVAGQARAGSGITSLAINHTPLTRPESGRVFFSRVEELNPGENIITIEAVDAAGNMTARTIRVARKPASRLQLSGRLSLAVLPFKHETAVSNTLPGFQDRLTHALARENRFQLIERSRIDLILREQHLNRTSLVSSRTA